MIRIATSPPRTAAMVDQLAVDYAEACTYCGDRPGAPGDPECSQRERVGLRRNE